ncbi:MAG: sulfite exporter TauE/SafE family protein [Flavobacterium sp.]|nr:sulfite exporter TauE/SafE family protein [Flavobacterium sp.]
MEYVGYFAAMIIGIALGLIGGGGSILTVPILVYLFNIDPETATSYSLFVVGVTALVGSYRYFNLGYLKLRQAAYFGLPSIISLLLMRNILMPIIPESLFVIGQTMISKSVLIMLIFALLMIAASYSMIKKSSGSSADDSLPDFRKLVMVGFIIGIIIGFLGAGGGFLIIPALLIFGKLSMKQSVGTSLLIIAVNSLIGFGGDLVSGLEIKGMLLVIILIMAIIGMFIGTIISKRINGAALKPAFGWFILLMGSYIIIKELFFH